MQLASDSEESVNSLYAVYLAFHVPSIQDLVV